MSLKQPINYHMWPSNLSSFFPEAFCANKGWGLRLSHHLMKSLFFLGAITPWTSVGNTLSSKRFMFHVLRNLKIGWFLSLFLSPSPPSSPSPSSLPLPHLSGSLENFVFQGIKLPNKNWIWLSKMKKCLCCSVAVCSFPVGSKASVFSDCKSVGQKGEYNTTHLENLFPLQNSYSYYHYQYLY